MNIMIKIIENISYFFFFLLLCFNIAFAQNQDFDPFDISAKEAKEKGVKKIQSPAINVEEEKLDHRNFSEDVRAIYFNQEGHPTLEKEFNYKDKNRYGGYDIYYQYEYKQGKLIKIKREKHSFFQYYRKDLIYKGDQLVIEEENWNDSNPRQISYKYRADGKLDTLKTWRRYPELETFFYEGNLLIKKNYFQHEDDESPASVTHYFYTDEGVIHKEVETTLDDDDQVDTSSFKLFNEGGQLIEYRTAETGDQYYSQNPPYLEYRFYNTSGQLIRKKMTGGVYGTTYYTDKEELYYPEIFYQYNELGQLTQADSLSYLINFTYTPFGKIQSKIVIDKKTKEEATRVTYHYNKAKQLVMYEQQDFVEGISQQWNMTYKNEQLLYQELLLSNLVRKCSFDYTYNDSIPAYSITEYCPVNSRGMPANLANSVDEFYYDANGNLIYQIHKGGHQDGSLTTSMTDTFIYKKNLLQQSIYTQFYNGKVHLKSSQINQYNLQNKLTYTYTLYDKDTVDIVQYFYDKTNQLLRSEKYKYPLPEDEIQRKPYRITEFLKDGKLKKVSNYNYKRKLHNIQEYEYNDRQLLIRYSVLNASLKRTEHKTYHYEYYE